MRVKRFVGLFYILFFTVILILHRYDLALKQTSVQWKDKQIYIRTYQYRSFVSPYIQYAESIDFKVLEILLNTQFREIHTTAIISIATHAAMSWLETVKNTLENFFVGGATINPRYLFVEHAGDRSKDVLSVPWTRWVTKNGPESQTWI